VILFKTRNLGSIGSARPSFALRFLLRWVAVLVAVVPSAAGQMQDQEKAGAASGSVKYQISATLTDYCRVERNLPLHEVKFDFHNKSCGKRSQVHERKTPTLPKSPLYTNVHLTGYHLIDWSEGHPSPSTRNTGKVKISTAATTLSALGWLDKATCTNGPKGDVLTEDTFWQAKVVPEVQFMEDTEQQEPAVLAELVPPQATVVMKLSASCESDREQRLEYTVTPIMNGVAQPSFRTATLKAGEKAVASEMDGAVSIHAEWSSLAAKGAASELSITISGSTTN
jgi:hypothetical protein